MDATAHVRRHHLQGEGHFSHLPTTTINNFPPPPRLKHLLPHSLFPVASPPPPTCFLFFIYSFYVSFFSPPPRFLKSSPPLLISIFPPSPICLLTLSSLYLPPPSCHGIFYCHNLQESLLLPFPPPLSSCIIFQLHSPLTMIAIFSFYHLLFPMDNISSSLQLLRSIIIFFFINFFLKK